MANIKSGFRPKTLMKDVIFGVQNPSEQGVHFSLRILVFASVRVLM